jgi:glutamate synthase (NADPH) small chain
MSPTASKSKNPLSPKERIKVPRQLMPEQPADVRAHNFEEVNLGYSPELAQQEALRCLECAKPTCTDNCPVGVDVKEFVQRIVIGDFLGAAAKIREATCCPRLLGACVRRKISAKGSACCRRR